MDQYPSEADLAAVRIGKAGAPIGKPRVASEVAWPVAGTAAAAP
jgi:penicillin-binding protein 2